MALYCALSVIVWLDLQGGGGSAAGTYSLLPDYNTYQPDSPSANRSRPSSSGGGSDSFCVASSSPTGVHSPLAASSSSGSRTARSSCCGDGVCEIALVLQQPSAAQLGDEQGVEGAADTTGTCKAAAGKGADDVL